MITCKQEYPKYFNAMVTQFTTGTAIIIVISSNIASSVLTDRDVLDIV